MNYYATVTDRMAALFLDKQFTAAKIETEAIIKEVEILEGTRDVGYVQHLCYTLLGLVAFEEKDFASARTYLLKSVTDLESAILKTFGPVTLLVYKFSCRRDHKTVEEYLLKCKSVVEMEDLFRLTEWLASAQSGEQPDFGKSIYVHLGVNEELRQRLQEYAPLNCP